MTSSSTFAVLLIAVVALFGRANAGASQGLRCYTFATGVATMGQSVHVNDVKNVHYSNAKACYKLAITTATKTFVKFGAITEPGICDSKLEANVKKAIAELPASAKGAQVLVAHCCTDHNCNIVEARNSSLNYKCSQGYPQEAIGTSISTVNMINKYPQCKVDCLNKGMYMCRISCDAMNGRCGGFIYRRNSDCILLTKVQDKWGPPANASNYMNSCMIVPK